MALGVEQAMEGPPGTVRTAEICAFIPCRKGEGLVTIDLVCHIATVEREAVIAGSARHMLLSCPLSHLCSPVGSAPRRWSDSSRPPLRQGCSLGNGMQRSRTSGRRRSCLRGLSGNQSSRSRHRLRTRRRKMRGISGVDTATL